MRQKIDWDRSYLKEDDNLDNFYFGPKLNNYQNIDKSDVSINNSSKLSTNFV